jgi:hypothetical protein
MRILQTSALLATLGLFTVGVAPALGDSSTTTTVSTTTSAPTTTTTMKPVHVAPLTGLPDPSGLTKHRPALTVKIDNTFDARPQYGINKADIVYEEICEGGITRLAAIFNSRLSLRVGPVRSVRRTDREIVYPIGGIFAFSGGALYALKSIRSAPVKLFDQSSAGAAMFRDPKRYPPHNLYANVAALIKRGGRPTPPPALFTYTPVTAPPIGGRVHSFVVGFAAGYATTWTWNARSLSWDRAIFGRPDVTADGARLSPKNVVVLSVHYRGGVGVEGAQAVLTGSGPVRVFTKGRMINGSWSRGANLRKPIVVRSADGKVIALAPGSTWVELLDVSEHVTLTSLR